MHMYTGVVCNENMHVYVHVYSYVYTCVHTYVYSYIMYTCIQVYTGVICIYVRRHTCCTRRANAYTHVSICVYTCTYLNCMYMCVHTYVHMCACENVKVNEHVHARLHRERQREREREREKHTHTQARLGYHGRLPPKALSEGRLGYRDRSPAQRGPGTGRQQAPRQTTRAANPPKCQIMHMMMIIVICSNKPS